MNKQTLTPVVTADLLQEWDEIIRASWSKRLRDLDTANIWYMPDAALSMISLVYRKPGNNTHLNTDWFLIDPHTDAVRHYAQQHLMYNDVRPTSGFCTMLWQRSMTWYTMAEQTPYAFNIQTNYITGRVINAAEV